MLQASKENVFAAGLKKFLSENHLLTFSSEEILPDQFLPTEEAW